VCVSMEEREGGWGMRGETSIIKALTLSSNLRI
jgi:hypothetical protein